MSSPRPKPRDLRSDALGLLRRRSLSHHELLTRLQSRGHARDAIEPLIAELRALGLVDDRRLASSVARLHTERHESAALARDRIAGRGIDEPTVRSALAAARPSGSASDRELAIDLARTQLRGRLASLPIETQARRLAALLARRGHDPDTVESVLAELLPRAVEPLPSPDHLPEP